MVNERLKTLADAILALSWKEMAGVSEYIADEYTHLKKSDKLDRDGVAQSLCEMAEDIATEFDRHATAQAQKGE